VRDGDFAEPGFEIRNAFGKEERSLFKEAEVGSEVFDLGEVVGGDEDGHAFACEKAEDLNELIADEGIEAGEGFIEDEERGAVGERADESGFHAHTAGEALEAAVEGKIETLEERGFEGAIPLRIEGADEVKETSDSHPLGHLLIFGDVADVGEGVAAEFR